MKYQAKPITVEAFIIVGVGAVLGDGSMHVATQDGTNRTASREMIARFIPGAGDYWVIQEDGYEYLNPKEVFERKYLAVREKTRPPYETFARPTCRGSFAFGSACGSCEKCVWERTQNGN